jgi:hypothetical protein
MSSYIREAFNKICEQARQTESWFVNLCESSPYYGGPEEGGWWGHDTHVVAYQEFPSEELAEAAKEQVLKLAKELQEESRREYGEYCLRSMEWLEARELDADYLPEPDGPSEYYVAVTRGAPAEATYGCRHYE